MPSGDVPQPISDVPQSPALEEAVDALSLRGHHVGEVVVRRLSKGGAVASIWEFDPGSRELICSQSSLADLTDRRIPLGVGIAGWVASRREEATVVDRRVDSRGDHYAGDVRVPTAGAAVPIPSGQHYTGGVLEVYGHERVPFTHADLLALGRLAAVIAADMREHGDAEYGGAHRLESAGEHLRSLSGGLLSSERQNRRMAAELHDGVSQRLASLSFYLAAANEALAETCAGPPDPAAGDPVQFAMRQIEVAGELTQLAADDVRAAITGLRPPVLDDLGLAKGLASLCAALGGQNLAVQVDVEGAEPPFVAPAAALALYRVAQEALGNVLKHAGVASVRVSLQRRADSVVLDVRDDGVGYQQGTDGTAQRLSADGNGGLGLRSMAERVAAVGGHIELWSAPGRGTHVHAIVPDPPA